MQEWLKEAPPEPDRLRAAEFPQPVLSSFGQALQLRELGDSFFLRSIDQNAIAGLSVFIPTVGEIRVVR
jgi:hypothetical protein